MKKQFTILHFNLSFIGLATGFIALPFSIKICHAGIILFLLMWILEGDWKEKIKIIKGSFLLQLIAGLFVMTVVGLLYTQNLYNGWLVIEKKIFFLLLPLALATTNQQFTSVHINRLLQLFICACFIGSIISISSAWNATNEIFTNDYIFNNNFPDLKQQISKSWFQFSYISLAEGIHIHPTFFSLYIAFSIVLLFIELLKGSLIRQERFFLWALILYFLVFLICLSSRIVIGALLMIVICYIIYEIRYSANKRNAITVAALVLVFSVLLYVNPISRYRSIHEVASTSFTVKPNSEYKTSIQIRLSLWWLALRSVDKVNFVAGTGAGDVKAVMEESGNKYAISNTLDSYDPHNQFLFSLLSYGIIGLALLILNFAAPMYYAWKVRDYLYLIFVFLCCSLCLTESAFELQKGIVFYALINSLLLLRLDAFKTFIPFAKGAH